MNERWGDVRKASIGLRRYYCSIPFLVQPGRIYDPQVAAAFFLVTSIDRSVVWQAAHPVASGLARAIPLGRRSHSCPTSPSY